ncbi:MAG: DEAD/DEAH box helicase [Candidatus Pacebacteria bacterium]|nr:DEAD/DEAH box helicase [Candidatus Paceibacterota bacterium]
MKFTEFNFKPELAKAIAQAGFREPSPIQAQAIPHVLSGKDVVGQAHTGTGKTAAFALPILENMKCNGDVEVVVIVPTRELAIQVADEIYKFSRLLSVRTATVYGGTSYKRQLAHIDNAGVIVATPGRFLDLLSRKKIDINPKAVVLDEADEMLNMGFLEDIRHIFSYFESRSQTLMFSATMPEEIKELSKTLMKKPEFIKVEQEKTVTNNNIKQYFYVVDEHERDDALLRLIDYGNPKKAIVFCRTKRETGRVSEFLKGQGYNADSLHGDMEQYDRRTCMQNFRKNKIQILVATDVAARGIDVRGVTHVINYHIPLDPESYVHRIGRTGRAKRSGTAMLLVTPHELRELKRIQKDMGSELKYFAIPSNTNNPEDKIQDIIKRIQGQAPTVEMQKLLKKVQGKNSLETLAVKMLAALHDEVKEQSTIGKSHDEITELLKSVENDSGESESKKSSRKYKESQNRRNNRSRSRKGRDEIRRGTGRGEVPIPTIEKVGGSRIVARKLF